MRGSVFNVNKRLNFLHFCQQWPDCLSHYLGGIFICFIHLSPSSCQCEDFSFFPHMWSFLSHGSLWFSYWQFLTYISLHSQPDWSYAEQRSSSSSHWVHLNTFQTQTVAFKGHLYEANIWLIHRLLMKLGGWGTEGTWTSIHKYTDQSHIKVSIIYIFTVMKV